MSITLLFLFIDDGDSRARKSLDFNKEQLVSIPEEPELNEEDKDKPEVETSKADEIPEDDKTIALKSINGFSVNTITKRSLVTNNAGTPRASWKCS